MTAFTKWWYVFPVDAPDTKMKGFPLPFVCPGWHTSMSLQIFLVEFFIDLITYFAFWFVLVYGINRFLIRIKIHKIFTILLLTTSGLLTVVALLIAVDSTNVFYAKRPFEIQVLEVGYEFIWQDIEKPDWNDYERDI